MNDQETTEQVEVNGKSFKRLLCFIGWHTWTWKLPKDGILYLNAEPPVHAKCRHCGKRYGKEENGR